MAQNRSKYYTDPTVTTCLNCPVAGDCDETSPYCPLRQQRMLKRVMEVEDVPAEALPKGAELCQ